MFAGRHWQTGGHGSEDGLRGTMKLIRTLQFSGATSVVAGRKRMRKMRIGSVCLIPQLLQIMFIMSLKAIPPLVYCIRIVVTCLLSFLFLHFQSIIVVLFSLDQIK